MLFKKATQSNINPIYLLLPMILSVSLAFALPIATPPNAVIFSYGNLKMRDMVSLRKTLECRAKIRN